MEWNGLEWIDYATRRDATRRTVGPERSAREGAKNIFKNKLTRGNERTPTLNERRTIHSVHSRANFEGEICVSELARK